jgi:hypothetical protein
MGLMSDGKSCPLNYTYSLSQAINFKEIIAWVAEFVNFFE